MKLPKRKSNRLKDYDYSQNGAYFITICTHNKECILGEIVGAVIGRPNIKLFKCGKLVDEAINNIPLFYENIKIDKYVTMPNHVHLILMIDDNKNGRPMTAPTLSQIINQTKGFVTKQMKTTVWQKSFHDHIIRNEPEYQKIWEYIDTNPLKWELDCYHVL